MAERQSRASLSKGRSGWCVILRHPVCRTPDGKDKLRIRRGLGTRDDAEAQAIVDQLNDILDKPDLWNPAARERAELKYAPQAIGAFYDCLMPEITNGWAARESLIPLPDASKGYARMLLVGTTGAGKTTVVRQVLGTNPETERFPSTSAAKTTICDIEIVFDPGLFRVVVAFMPKDHVRQYIADCVTSAVSRHIQAAGRAEVTRRFLEHTDQQFRLSYVLGVPKLPSAEAPEELFDDDDDAPTAEDQDAALISPEERQAISARVEEYVDAICRLAESIAGSVESALGERVNKNDSREMDAFEELVEEHLGQHDAFHALVDEVLDDVESRFDHLAVGEVERGRDGWPRLWHWTSDDRAAFIREINRFSSNYAPNFGRLLTPLVDGIRVAGPFRPYWQAEVIPKLVLLDGRGIGHTADSSSSVSTTITRRYELADAILLVDNAAQPMQAGPCAVLRSLAASGHESKLILCFTHFDEVKGDNLLNQAAKKAHVLSSVDNAVHAVGKALGRDAEHSLTRLLPDRAIFLSNIQKRLGEGARFTIGELSRLLALVEASTVLPEPVDYKPVYDVANLVLAIQRAAVEFHDMWRGVLGMGTRSGVAPEHWTRVKALTRHVGLLRRDEYDTLRPVADLIRLLQTYISQYLSTPLEWFPGLPPEDQTEQRIQAIDAIKKNVFTRLHSLSTRRLLEERWSGWVDAFEHRGTGSTRVRAREIVTLYESAAPVPTEMPGPDANEFLFEIRELTAESILAGGGDVRGWSRSEDSEEVTA